MNTSKAGANATLVEREKLIYPLASLVKYFFKTLMDNTTFHTVVYSSLIGG